MFSSNVSTNFLTGEIPEGGALSRFRIESQVSDAFFKPDLQKSLIILLFGDLCAKAY